MTENKRFIFDRDTVATNIKMPIVFDNEQMNIGEVLNKLNELYNENKQLNQQISDNFNQSNCITVQKSIISDLKKENKELKENCKNYNWYKQCKTLLNENDELKVELNKLEGDLDYYKAKCASLEVGMFNLERDYGKLKKENQELKERNNRQAKQLDRLYNLIEEKDWRTLSDILDDFKRCEEQLHKEWKCYE